MSLDEFGIADLLGIAGFATYACADTLLALRRLHSDQIRFYVIYAVAGVLILCSLTIDFNMGAFLTEAFSLLTCGVAIVLRLTRPRMLTFVPPPGREIARAIRPASPSRG